MCLVDILMLFVVRLEEVERLDDIVVDLADDFALVLCAEFLLALERGGWLAG